MTPDEPPAPIPLCTEHDTSRQRVEAVDAVINARPPDWFRTAFLALSEAVYVVDTTGHITFANTACEVLTGYASEELVGRSSLDLYPPEVADVFMVRRQLAYQGHTLPALETELIRKNGKRFHVELSVTSLVSNGQVSGRLTLLRDITERKEAEKLRSWLVAIVNSTDVAIIGKTLEGMITSWNAGAEHLYGYTAAEVLGRSITLLMPPDCLDEMPAIFARLRRGEHIEHVETQRLTKGGRRLDIGLTISPIFDAAGAVIGASSVAQDITARKRSEARFHLAIEAAPSAMVMIDDEGRIVLVNAQAERFFGYDRTELLGQSIELLVPERFRSKHANFRQAYMQAAIARAMGAGRDLYGLRKDGMEFPVEIGLTPVTSGDGPFVLSAIVDITERKRAEDETRQHNRDLETLLQVISHDLREPLRAIGGFSQLLHERYPERLDDKGRDFLRRIVRGVDRMSKLLDDLLMLAQARRMRPPMATVDLRLIICDVLRQLDSQVRATGAQVKMAQDFPYLRVNRTWASRGIYNLVSNALKFTRDGEAPEVEIVPYRTASEVGIAVRDRGPGIETAELRRIFHLFRRATGREVPGTGAGLAIVQQIAERHGGRVWAQPRDGGGAEFVLTFGQGEA